MQTEASARVGVAMEGGAPRALGNRGVFTVDGGAKSYSTRCQGSSHRRLQFQSQMGSMLAGGIAGAVAKTCTAPLSRLTILFQVQGMHCEAAVLKNTGIWHEMRRIVREEGYKAFWKGNMVTVVHRLPYSAISFYSYESYKGLLQSAPSVKRYQDFASADVVVRFLSGGLAGMTAASVTYPLDLVRTRLATQTKMIYYRGVSHALYSICRDEGIAGLYKGLRATLLGVGPNLAISFGVYETVKSYWITERPHDSPLLSSLACGSLSGIASSTVSFPFDLVRRRMQLEGACGRARVYGSGVIGTFRDIVRGEGFCGLYRGIFPEYAKVVPGVAIVFMTYEALKPLLSS